MKEYLDKSKKELAELGDKEWKDIYGKFQKSHEGQKIPKEEEFRKAVEAAMK